MNIFKNAHTKLALFYMMIAMVVSIAFSIALYNISTNEINRGLGKQNKIAVQMRGNPIIDELENLRQTQLDESAEKLRLNLLYFNFIILILSAVAGYFLSKKTLEPIEEAMDAQNRFTADASHELRTPLTAMRTEIEVAMRDKGMNLSEAKALLESNLEEISKLEILSNALLKLAKNDASATKEFRSVFLPDIIVEAYERIESLAREKNIQFENSFQEIAVLGDREGLLELFVILLDNAVKYSPKKSKINIDIEESGNDAIVKITDRGIGIKASDLPNIFNRFYRADHSRNKEKADGYGLGLSIAKQIVDLHNGKITVESKSGKGSEFTIRLSKYTTEK